MKDWPESKFIFITAIRYANENMNVNENRNPPINDEEEEMDESLRRVLEMSKHQK
jgi:hypothetical protein